MFLGHQNYFLLGKHLATALLAVTKKKVVKRSAYALNRPPPTHLWLKHTFLKLAPPSRRKR
jgi:hypothetical protein